MKSITISNKESNKVANVKKSLFVSFSYDIETVDRIKKLPTRYYNPKKKEWEVPTRYSKQLASLFQDYEIKLEGSVDKKLRSQLQDIAKFDEVDYTGYSYKTDPFEHQREGFEYGMEHNKFLLGDEQGLGKTKQAIDIAVARKKQFKHVLIVCGVNSLKYNWKQEIAVHSNENSMVLGSRLITRGKNKGKERVGSSKERLADLQNGIEEFFIITNIETLRNKEIQEVLEEKTLSGEIGMVVIDEIHKAKNAQSTQGKAIHSLKSFYKMALTGTALMNSPLDLFNVLKWLDEEQGPFYRFRGRYCVMGGFGGYEVVDYQNLEELRSRLEAVQLRRKKEEVLDLPPKIRTTEYVELEGAQGKLYSDIKEQVMLELDDIVLNPNPLSQLTRLRQVTSNPNILDNDMKNNAKMERLQELVSEIVSGGQKAIIYSEWEKVTAQAYNYLLEHNPAYIAGNADTEQEKSKFKQDDSCKVVIGTRSKLGTGHTLTEANYVIFIDKPWNLANTEQAEDRAHRIGTTGTVNIITLVAKDTIDENIEDIIFKKGNMSKAIVDSDFGNLDQMDKRELVELLLA